METPVITFSGSYAYNDPNGVQTVVEYVADEKGYAPRVKVNGLAKEYPSTPVTSYAYAAPAVSADVIESLVG